MLNISLEIIDWLKKHIQIENERDVIPDIHERDIFWCKIGYNIGFEQFGKGRDFTRPVLVIKKFNKNLFIGVPLSTKIKEENKYYVTYSFKEEKNSALISQIRVLDTKRLGIYLGRLNEKDFLNIKNKIKENILNI
jgi:mRNA interferase MazF